MAKITYKPHYNFGGPSVYFTCHPDDFRFTFRPKSEWGFRGPKLLRRIFPRKDYCRIFELVDGALLRAGVDQVYYTTDMSETLTEENKELELKQMKFFVVPITKNLLTTPSRTMEVDLVFAEENGIPILPIMMEPGLDELYRSSAVFGELQYVNAYGGDTTGISYEGKLKSFLETTVLEAEMTQKIRASFDAYVFLSYRKKDRRYANALMHQIHSSPEFANVAIWYDEFLTPGEEFNENIREALERRQLVLLLVTPSVLEDTDGKPNYVVGEEYPAAKRAGKPILPIEMVSTDRTLLSDRFPDLPDCVDPENWDELRSRLLELLRQVGATPRTRDPESDYLLGLAYLNGIDVETNANRAEMLITSAAEAEYPDAMEKICDLYRSGGRIKADRRKALAWAERIADVYTERYGEEHSYALWSLSHLSTHYRDLKEFDKALELQQKVLATRRRLLGPDHAKTVDSLWLMAVTYNKMKDHAQEVKLRAEICMALKRTVGVEAKEMEDKVRELSNALKFLFDYQHQRPEVWQELAEEMPELATMLHELAVAWNNEGLKKYRLYFERAMILCEGAYLLAAEIYGEAHLETASILHDLARIRWNYSHEIWDAKSAIPLGEKLYDAYVELLGKDHPNTKEALRDLAWYYWVGKYYLKAARCFEELADYDSAMIAWKKTYRHFRSSLGFFDPSTREAQKKWEEMREKVQSQPKE